MDFLKTNQRKIRLGTLLLLTLLLVSSILWTPRLSAPQVETHWLKIHLPPSVLAIRSDLCQTSKMHFIGCYRAARALVSLEELSHLANLLPDWNEDDEVLLASKFSQHKHKPLIHFGTLFDRLNREVRMHVSRTNESEAVAFALNRWLTAIDPHAHLEPMSWESEQTSGAIEVEGGIGLRWKNLRGKALVVKVRAGSPAATANLRVGDQILMLDGVDFHRVSPRKKHYILLGDGATPVQLMVIRGRQEINVIVAPKPQFKSNVEFAIDRTTANIRIHDFKSANTCSEFGRLLLKAERHKVKMIHLDLRDNPGGTVEQAVCVAGLLLGPNWKFAELRPIPRSLFLLPFEPVSADTQTLKTDRGQLTRLPLFVSVNHNTASAAEMLAAALQDHGRALIEGTRTFGKGTMQSGVHPWNRRDLSLRYSTHLIYRPTGKPLHHMGVVPDRSGEQGEESTFLREENFYPQFPSLKGA